MAYQAKVYVVQRFDHDGRHGPVVAVKLTHADAHRIAKDHAPAKVTCVIADKTPEPNVDRFASQRACK